MKDKIRTFIETIFLGGGNITSWFIENIFGIVTFLLTCIYLIYRIITVRKEKAIRDKELELLNITIQNLNAANKELKPEDVQELEEPDKDTELDQKG